MGEIATHDAGRPPADDAHVPRSLTADSGLAGRAVRRPRGRALEQLDRGRSRAVEQFGVGEDSSRVRPATCSFFPSMRAGSVDHPRPPTGAALARG
jgi:hypothetical protein